MPAEAIEKFGLDRNEAAALVGMSTRVWDELWKGGNAPQPSRPFASVRNPRWSKDELRSWVAYGYPNLERWKVIWARLLESGAWAPAEVVIREKGAGDAA